MNVDFPAPFTPITAMRGWLLMVLGLEDAVW
jgi:hypothetical protein